MPRASSAPIPADHLRNHGDRVPSRYDRRMQTRLRRCVRFRPPNRERSLSKPTSSRRTLALRISATIAPTQPLRVSWSSLRHSKIDVTPSRPQGIGISLSPLGLADAQRPKHVMGWPTSRFIRRSRQSVAPQINRKIQRLAYGARRAPFVVSLFRRWARSFLTKAALLPRP
jgi:hypothetical protein